MSPRRRDRKSHWRPLAGAATALLLASAVGPAALTADDEEPEVAPACIENQCGHHCQSTLDVARRHTVRYLNEEVAVADGFVADPICVEAPGVGGMGIHYSNLERMTDTEVDPRYPEILLYVQRPSGRLDLVAVEYHVPVLSGGEPWFGSESEPPPGIDNPPPVLFGRTFDGPMPGHNPFMPWHYDLHVWLWRYNPAGTFAPFNPKVDCP